MKLKTTVSGYRQIKCTYLREATHFTTTLNGKTLGEIDKEKHLGGISVWQNEH